MKAFQALCLTQKLLLRHCIFGNVKQNLQREVEITSPIELCKIQILDFMQHKKGLLTFDSTRMNPKILQRTEITKNYQMQLSVLGHFSCTESL